MSGDSDQQKLKSLAARIAKAQESADPSRRAKGGDGMASRSILRGVRIGSDFVASVMVPTALGAFLDERLETGPWLMLALLAGGFALGIWTLISALGPKGQK